MRVRASLGAFRGAAGSTTHAMEKRLQAERGESAARKPLLKDNSEIDAIVFGYDMDKSSADDAVEDALYAGMFGTRSRCFNPGTDMATRSTAHTTGEQVYGAHISGGAIRDVQPTKPYVTEGVAGKTTQEIAKFDGQLICITNRPIGVGSSVVNPTEADKLVLGFDIDASQPDRRDFEGSAGGGAHGMQRPVGSIDHVEKRKMIVEPHEAYDPRFGPRVGKVGAIETDFSHGTRSTMTIARARQQDGYAGEEYNATRGQHTRASVMDMGAMHAAGIDRMLVQDYGMPDADGHYYNLEYAGKHTKDLAADRGYMTVKEKDHVGSHDVATHPAFRGTAGLPQGADEMTAGKRALPLEYLNDKNMGSFAAEHALSLIGTFLNKQHKETWAKSLVRWRAFVEDSREREREKAARVLQSQFRGSESRAWVRESRRKALEKLEAKRARMAKRTAKLRKAARYIIGTMRFWRFRMAALEVVLHARRAPPMAQS